MTLPGIAPAPAGQSGDTGGAKVALRGVSKWFTKPNGEQYVALHDVNFGVPTGGFTAIVGPSGCGQ